MTDGGASVALHTRHLFDLWQPRIQPDRHRDFRVPDFSSPVLLFRLWRENFKDMIAVHNHNQ